MPTVLVLRRVRIQNANAIAGLTYGFPAITQFLGFAHALSRKLQPVHGIVVNGLGVICHSHQPHICRSSALDDYVFALTRNPLTKEGNTASIVEEGRMSLEVSLLLDCEGLVTGNDEQMVAFAEDVKHLVQGMRIAGGQINSIQNAKVHALSGSTADNKLRKLLRQLLPGFALIDRSGYMNQHYQNMLHHHPDSEHLDAWLDFAALKYKAQAVAEGDGGDVQWQYQKKPYTGYLVPMMVGYKAISPIYQPGEVANTRDLVTPTRFVEPAYSVGEWISPHRINRLDQIIWRYKTADDWYLCTTGPLAEDLGDPEEVDDYTQF